MKGDFMTVRFDRHNPASEKRRAEDVRGSLAGLDYSPLPRVTGRSLAMGVLVSMGGMMCVSLTLSTSLMVIYYT